MNIEKLQACADVLGQMSVNLNAMPTGDSKAAQAALICTMAQSYVVEYSAHLAGGMEPFDAMTSTVNGELEIDEAKAVVLRILSAKPSK